MHLKRNKANKFWPIPRKGYLYVSRVTHNLKDSIPIVTVLRDVLKVVQTKKELKRILNEKKVLINQKEIRETNYPVCLFDIISLPALKKNYKTTFSVHKKMIFEEVSDKEATTKVFKVMSKKILTGKKIQLNLMFGKNILSNEKVNTGDSLVYDFKTKKIVKILPVEKGKNVLVIKGKHEGNQGKIETIVEEAGKKIIKLKTKDGAINVWAKNIIVIE